LIREANLNDALALIGVAALLLAGLGGWILGYLTERGAGGSIIPAILVHGFLNFVLVMEEALF